jgi:hypothetical protein
MHKPGSTLTLELNKNYFPFIRILRQQDVAKWMPTKEKGRFARKNSLVPSGKPALGMSRLCSLLIKSKKVAL